MKTTEPSNLDISTGMVLVSSKKGVRKAIKICIHRHYARLHKEKQVQYNWDKAFFPASILIRHKVDENNNVTVVDVQWAPISGVLAQLQQTINIVGDFAKRYPYRPFIQTKRARPGFISVVK